MESVMSVLEHFRQLGPVWETSKPSKQGDCYIVNEVRFKKLTPDGELKGMIVRSPNNTGSDGFIVQVYMETVKAPARIEQRPGKEGKLVNFHIPEQREVVPIYREECLEFVRQEKNRFTLLRQKMKTRVTRSSNPDYWAVKNYFEEITRDTSAAEGIKKDGEKREREELERRLREQFFV